MRRNHLTRMAWHAMMRGARRLLLFRDDADRAAFLRILTETLEEKQVTLHSWVLMDNQYHLLVTADWDVLGRFMQSLNRRFSRGNNVKYELKGHLFEGSYLSFPQRSPFWMGRTARYIDYNPVRAGMVKSPEAYRWSSCRAYVRGDTSPVPIEKKTVLDAAGGRAAYAQYEPPVTRKRSTAQLTAMDVWQDQVAWLLHYARQRSDLLDGEAPQTIAAAWARRAGVPPRAIAKSLGYASGHSVSVLLDTVRKRSESDPHLRKVLAVPEI